MAFREILDNNPKAIVSYSGLKQMVYDVINRRIVGEDRSGDIPVDTVCAIPEFCIDMVAALMTSTTRLQEECGEIVFYARSLLWICAKAQLISVRLIPEQYTSYFDESQLRIYIGVGYAYTHQSRNVLLITRYDELSYAAPHHMLVTFPATFTIISFFDDGYNSPILVHDSRIQQTYTCKFEYRIGVPMNHHLKVVACTYPSPYYEVDIGVYTIVD